MRYKILYLPDSLEQTNSNIDRLAGQLILNHSVNCPNIYQEPLNTMLEKYGYNHTNIDNHDLIKYTEKTVEYLSDLYTQFKPDIVIAVGLGSLIATQLIDTLKCSINIIFIKPTIVNIYESLPKILNKSQTIWMHNRQDKSINYKHVIQASQKSDGTLILTNNSGHFQTLLNNNVLLMLIESLCGSNV